MSTRLFYCIACCLLLAVSVTQAQDDGDFSIDDFDAIGKAVVEEIPASSLALYEKRQELIIPELKLENVTLAEACEQLSALTVALDPGKHGLVIQVDTDKVESEAAGLRDFNDDLKAEQLLASFKEAVNARRFSLHLIRVPMMTAMHYVELKAGSTASLLVGPTKGWREPVTTDFPTSNIENFFSLLGVDPDESIYEGTLTPVLATFGILSPYGSQIHVAERVSKIVATNTAANLDRFKRLLAALDSPDTLLLADTRVIHVTDQAFLDSRALKPLTWADVAALSEASRPVIFHSATPCTFGETIHAEDSQTMSIDGQRQLVSQALTLTGKRCARDHIHAELTWSLSIKSATAADPSPPRAELAAEFDLVSDGSGAAVLAVGTPLKDGKPDGQYLLVVTLRRVRLDNKPLPDLDRLLKAFVDESAPEIVP